MSKQTREFFDKLKEDPKTLGAIEAAVQGVREAVQAYAPGLTLSNILQDVGAELKQQMAHGSHEMAAALFRGDAFVLYPREGKESENVQGHGLPDEVQKEQERGGREM